jgi:hypothetical protein
VARRIAGRDSVIMSGIPSPDTTAALLTLAVIYGMVVLGFGKRRLVWRTKCRVCGGPRGLCRCHYPRF